MVNELGAGAPSEEALSEVVGQLCFDEPADSELQGKYPGNPPLWVERYRLEAEDDLFY